MDQIDPGDCTKEIIDSAYHDVNKMDDDLAKMNQGHPMEHIFRL